MFKRMLVPLDGSSLAEAILPQVQDLAKALGAELFLVRAAAAHVFPGADPTEEEVDVVQKAEAYLAEVAGRLCDAGIPIHTAVRYGRGRRKSWSISGSTRSTWWRCRRTGEERPQPVGAGERRGARWSTTPPSRSSSCGRAANEARCGRSRTVWRQGS